MPCTTVLARPRSSAVSLRCASEEHLPCSARPAAQCPPSIRSVSTRQARSISPVRHWRTTFATAASSNGVQVRCSEQSRTRCSTSEWARDIHCPTQPRHTGTSKPGVPPGRACSSHTRDTRGPISGSAGPVSRAVDQPSNCARVSHPITESTAKPQKTKARYSLERMKSFSGRTGVPARTPAYKRCATTRNQMPEATATTE